MDNITKIGQLLLETLTERIEQPDDLGQMERELRQLLQECGQAGLSLWVASLTPAYPEDHSDCPHCHQEAEYIRWRSGRLRTLQGTMPYRRPYYLCPHCHRGHYPFDNELGLRPNQMSAEMERLGGMIGVEIPFGQGSDIFGELTLASLSDQSLDKAAQAYGIEMSAVEKEWIAQSQDVAEIRRRRQKERPPLRLYGSMDATKIHIHGDEKDPWRDLKIGAWFEARGRPPTKPDGEWRIQAENITYYADICEAKEFSTLFWGTGVQQNANWARELVILGDGAEWIWNLVKENFPTAVQIIDWFHACEYFMPVAKSAFQDEKQQQAWVCNVKDSLWNGELDDVIAACEAHVDPKLKEDPAEKAATYFRNNRSRMDYPTYRKQGYHIGSGTIESAAKQIGTQRMKVAGAIWNEDSARNVAKARAAYLSGQWDMLAQRRACLAKTA
jgi:hypothetical protein